MVDFIYLARESELKKFEVNGTETYLANLSKFNIFIGPNNSGKSRFIRTIFKLGNELPVNANPISWVQTREKGIRLVNNFERYFIKDANANNAIFKREKEFFKLKERILHNESERDLFSITQMKLFIHSIERNDFEGNDKYFHETLRRRKEELANLIGTFLEGFSPIRVNSTKYSFLYIPVLRGLRPIQLSGNAFGNDDNYAERTIYDYLDRTLNKSRASNNYKNAIFSGLSLYEEVTKLLLGDERQRNTIREFEQFLTEKIFEKPVTLIPKYKDDVLHIKIGDSPQLEVYNLGDGIQALITLLFPIFVKRNDNALIFIEEPEIHLHPHWQRKFVDALNQFENHQYFLTTHSNIFINLPNSSIFKVRTAEEEDKTYISYLNLRAERTKVLSDLGYKASDLLQTNFVLWVEGPSDMVYFNYWISKIDSTLQEGIHYTIMYYGGNNLDFLLNEGKLEAFADINVNFGVYLDSDKSKKGEKINERKQKIIDAFKEHANFCWISEKREIENYIDIDIFKQAVKTIHKDSSPQIEDGNYFKRTKPTDLNSNPTPKARIKIPEYLFTKIQKSEGQIKSIPAKDLKRGIQEAIDLSTNNTFNINKIEVAKKVIELSPEIKDKELYKKITELVEEIKKANNLKLDN